MEDESIRKKIRKEKYVTETVGLPTLNDILEELAKPGRDPREQFENIAFKDGIEKMEDLEPGMTLPGVVTNIVAFRRFRGHRCSPGRPRSREPDGRSLCKGSQRCGQSISEGQRHGVGCGYQKKADLPFIEISEGRLRQKP
jgi:hypothetical protein